MRQLEVNSGGPSEGFLFAVVGPEKEHLEYPTCFQRLDLATHTICECDARVAHGLDGDVYVHASSNASHYARV